MKRKDKLELILLIIGQVAILGLFPIFLSVSGFYLFVLITLEVVSLFFFILFLSKTGVIFSLFSILPLIVMMAPGVIYVDYVFFASKGYESIGSDIFGFLYMEVYLNAMIIYLITIFVIILIRSIKKKNC